MLGNWTFAETKQFLQSVTKSHQDTNMLSYDLDTVALELANTEFTLGTMWEVLESHNHYKSKL